MQVQTRKRELTPEQKERKLLMARLYKARHREEIREYNKNYKAENKDRLREYTREYRRANPDKLKEWLDRYADKNPETIRAIKQRWLVNNPEKRRDTLKRYGDANRDKQRDAQRAWRKANPERAKAIVNARRRRLRNARPPWADTDAIKAIYREAVRQGLTVDHIIPLENPLVCGLHVPANLQLMPYLENISKGNRFEIIHTTDAATDA